MCRDEPANFRQQRRRDRDDGLVAFVGGGIDNSGTLTILGSRLSKNTVPMHLIGGGIFNEYFGTVIMKHDVLTENAAEVGGGIFSVGNGSTTFIITSPNSGDYGLYAT